MTGTESCIISLRGITKEYNGEKVLKDLNLDIHDKEFITLLGPSGCGKTTTLRIIGGFVNPDAGDVIFSGKRVNHVPPYKRPVNTIFQKYALFPHLNVFENIAFGLRLKREDGIKLGKDEIKTRVMDMLEVVSLKGFEKRDVVTLSGGQQQRVAIARALVNRPKVLLLDEPLGALDLQLRRQMQIELKHLQEELGITFVYITHDQEEALGMSDRIAVMRNGIFEQIDSAQDIYNHPATSYVARFVGNANVFKGNDKRRTEVSAQDRMQDGVQSRTNCLAIRAEHIEFSSLINGRGIPARIVAHSFAGGQIRLTALLETGEEITACRQDMDSSLQNGMEVRVYWLPGNAIPVEDTD